MTCINICVELNFCIPVYISTYSPGNWLYNAHIRQFCRSVFMSDCINISRSLHDRLSKEILQNTIKRKRPSHAIYSIGMKTEIGCIGA